MAEEMVAAPAPTGLNQWQRVADTFVAPSSAFADILRSTSWWLPFVLLALATLGVAYTIDRQVGYEQVAETQIHLSPSQDEQLSSLTPDQRAAQMHRMGIGYRYSAYAYPVLILVFSALASLVLWVSFNFGLGAKTTYAQIFCLWMYCSLPRLLAAFVTVIMLCLGGSPETFDLKNAVGTSVAYYLPDAAPWVRSLFGFADVIGIWVLVLLTIGGAIVAKVKLGQAAAVVVGWWLLIVLVSVAATAAFS